MNSVLAAPAPRLPRLQAALPEWLPGIAGLAVLYVPTLYDLFNGLWATEEQAHGPIILALSLWLIYRKWPRMMERSAGQPVAGSGWLILLVGLLLYILGRSQQILMFEIGSLIWVLAAILLLKRGSKALKVVWFPLFFMLFMIPLPLQVVSALTLPMKIAVSYTVEHILFAAGFPIARNGVILQIGQYQLLVADACAGLQTLLTLEALGLFYLNIVQHTSVLRNVVLAIFIIPISFSANVIRVLSLTLITYYLGDEAGQGFLHDFAGIVLFLSALLLIVGLDKILQFFIREPVVSAATKSKA